MRTLSLYPEGDGWVADDLERPGTPGVGRGKTKDEALRNWIILSGYSINEMKSPPREIRVIS